MLTIKTIDAHAAGEPLRLIVDGFPAPRGRTMLEKREWVRAHADHIRQALMLEPRGHADMYGAILTEPVSPGSHAGVLFMHNEGYSTMCGHGIIAVTTIGLERGLLVPGGDGVTIAYDSPAGTIRARANVTNADEADGVRVESVAFVNVPSFVLHGALTVRLPSRTIRVDVAFGGAFYAIVDSEAVGVPIDVAHLAELRRIGMEIKRAIESQMTIAHPLEAGLKGIYGTIFTGPATTPGADLRNVTIFADAEVDRSPCGTGTAAVMAVLDAMGVLDEGTPFVHESLIGTTFKGRVSSRTAVADYQAIVPEIEGSAWITGDHTFVVAEDDPLARGFRI
ncbi:MAG TPA: proline racemase family protein [Vicinamibacterales bacterium]|jgi:proline racemase